MENENVLVILVAVLIILHLQVLSATVHASSALRWPPANATLLLPLAPQIETGNSRDSNFEASTNSVPTELMDGSSREVDDTSESCLYHLWPGFGDPGPMFEEPFDICRVV